MVKYDEKRGTLEAFLSDYTTVCRRHGMFVWNYRTHGAMVAVVRAKGEERGFTDEDLEEHLKSLREPDEE